jgi:hypothetical protein
MPRGPKGERRPADVIGNAGKVMRITTAKNSAITTPRPEKETKFQSETLPKRLHTTDDLDSYIRYLHGGLRKEPGEHNRLLY